MASIKYLIACLLLIASTGVLATDIPKFQLAYGKWRMISLPATPPDSDNTLIKVLGDDIGASGNYGQNWAVYAYNAGSNGYGEPLLLSDTLEKGRGYWIIQLIGEGESVTLEMPKGSSVTPNELIPLTTSKNGSNQWNLAGSPFSTPLNLDKLRLSTNASSCSEGNCDLDKAKENNLLHNKVWIYDGDSYKEKGMGDQLAPWDGFWAAALGGSIGHSFALGTSGGIAQAKIEAYAEDSENPAPTVQDYADAGVDGVTAQNLTEVNAAVEAVEREDVDTLAKLRAVVASLFSCITRAELDVMIENNEDVTQVDTSCITDMSWLFKENNIFNQDIGNWDVSNVTNMSGMFTRANAFNQDISSWDVSAVTDMSMMFQLGYDEPNYQTIFNPNIGSWDVSNVTNMRGMFQGLVPFNQDIGDWDVANVTDMSYMFHLAETFNQDIGGWDVSNTTKMYGMFSYAEAFNQDIGGWDVSNVTNMSGMFGYAKAFNYNIGSWDVSNVTNMYAMFSSAVAFNQDIGNWSVGNVTLMHYMFRAATAFNQDISDWDVSNVIAMRWMFSYARTFNQDIGNWNVSNVTTMYGMFIQAKSFNRDIGNWNVSNVTDMREMFKEAKAFNKDLGNWNVGNVTVMTRMFLGAEAFTNHDLSSWDVSNVTNHYQFLTGAGSGNTEPNWP